MCACIIIRYVSKGCYRVRVELEMLTPCFCPHLRADTITPSLGAYRHISSPHFPDQTTVFLRPHGDAVAVTSPHNGEQV